MLIQVQDLGYTYARGTPIETQALRGADLRIEPGERVGLLGPTGSGKSTFAQLVAGLLQPANGRVLLDGVPANGRGQGARSRRARVGLSFQYPEHQIFEQTVFKEVAYGARRQRLRGAELESRVLWALGVVGMDSAATCGRNPLSLSGGEMRRVGLAGILVRQPEVLILDEPTANLDPQGRRDLLARLLSWHRETHATMITITHSLDDLAHMADRVILLAEGSVIVDGSVGRVLADPDLLASVGFQVPGPVALLRALRDAGWTIPVDRLLVADVAAEIARAAVCNERAS